MEVELVALGALDHSQAVVARVREHAALLPLHLCRYEKCHTDFPLSTFTKLPHRPYLSFNTLLTAWPSSGTE